MSSAGGGATVTGPRGAGAVAAGTTGVVAHARVVAVPDGRGGTRLAELSSAFPVGLRRTAPAQVHVVATGAGPLGGDRLHLEVEVAPGAQLTLVSVGATLALPGRHGGRSVSQVAAEVGAGGQLDLRLGPTVVCAGAEHHAETRIELVDGARLRWRELVVLGRHAEPTGRLRLRSDVVGPDGPLLREVLEVDAASLGDPHRLGGARVLGTELSVGGPNGPGAPQRRGPGDGAGVRWGEHTLVGGGRAVVALGEHAHEVAAVLDAIAR